MGDRVFQNGDRDGDRERVREASDIAEVLRQHLALTPKGREYVALCPFHDDHKPSMYVVPSKQIYHCFSCGATGDVFSFVMKYLGLDFREALEMLAERAGVELTPWRRTGGISSGSEGGQPDDRGVTVPAEQVREALALTTDFYKAVLHKSDQGRASREMIKSRGINEAMVEKFGLGAAVDDWERLAKALRTKGVSDAAMCAAGVAKARESGGCFDMIRNRLVFPIHAQHGKVIAFGGRKLNPEDEPKYLNTPETSVFKKGKTLYGLSQAMPTIIKTGRVIVVEGYIDVIACHQYGFSNVVGTLGTALTREHARLLRGRCREVVLLFDADAAGQKAAFRAGEVFFGEPLDVRVAASQGGAGEDEAKDPDELLAEEGGSEVFESMVEGSRDVIQLRFEALRERVAGAGPAAVSAAVEEELGKLVEMGINEAPPLRRRFVIGQIARVLGLTAHDIDRMTPKGRSASRRSAQATGAEPGGTEPDAPSYHPTDPLSVREILLGCAMAVPEVICPSDRDLLRADAYSHPLLAVVAQGVERVLASGCKPGLDAVLRAIGDDEPARGAAIGLVCRVERIHSPAAARGQTPEHPSGHADQRSDQIRTTRLHEAWKESAARARRESASAAAMEIKSTVTDPAALLAERVRRKREQGHDARALPRSFDG